MQSTRINKYLAETGYCSRRQADELIKFGKVFINGEKAELGSQVNKDDEVKIGNKVVQSSENQEKIYIIYHKPVGVICTTDQTKPDNIIEKIGLKERIYPVGRLDVGSSGLILLTNDGEWANIMMHPRYEHEKEYLVKVDREIDDELISKLKKGVKLREGLAKADYVVRIKNYELRITIHQGWNRQIRRMLDVCGYKAISLKRIRVGEYGLGNLKAGEWEYIKSLRKD